MTLLTPVVAEAVLVIGRTTGDGRIVQPDAVDLPTDAVPLLYRPHGAESPAVVGALLRFEWRLTTVDDHAVRLVGYGGIRPEHEHALPCGAAAELDHIVTGTTGAGGPLVVERGTVRAVRVGLTPAWPESIIIVDRSAQ